MWQLFKNRLAPFRHSGFRQFFFAQNFSLIGTWSHELARSWLVLSLTGSATALGAVLLATSLPGLFLSLHGGVIADRVETKKFLMVTKGLLSLSALALCVITELGLITVPLLIFFGFIEGILNAYDGPLFTTLFARIIPKKDFQQALAIQSSNFHLARMVGPLVAGLLMAWQGPGLVFLFDAISYLGVMYVIWTLQLRPKEIESLSEIAPKDREKSDSFTSHDQISAPHSLGFIFSSIKTTHHKILKMFSSLNYFFDNKSLRYKLIHLFLTLSIILPLVTVVFRTFLKDKFLLDASQFGFLFAFPALGSMTGALYFILAQKERPEDNVRWAVPLLIVSLICVNFAPHPWLAAPLLAICGFFSYVNIASMTQSLHLSTSDSYRGRLGSLIGLGFTSLGPLMSFPLGYYTDKFGFSASIIHSTILFAVLISILSFIKKV